VLFVFLPGHEEDKVAMELEYPGGKWTEEKASQGETLYWLYEYTRE
jgi:hypothetical protein